MRDQPDTIKVPSRRRYVVGVAIGLLGTFVALVLLGKACVAVFNFDAVVIVPGSHQIQLDRGKYTIFYEYETVVNNRVFSTGESLGDLTVTLRPVSSSTSILVRGASADISYQFGSRAGRSILEFSTYEPGQHILEAYYTVGLGPEVVIAIGKSPWGWGVFGPVLASFVGGTAIGGFIILRTLDKRRVVSPPPLSLDPSSRRYRPATCPRCGSLIAEPSNFCPFCGSALNSTAIPPPAREAEVRPDWLEEVKLAGFWIRVLTAYIDMLVFLLSAALIGGVTFGLLYLSEGPVWVALALVGILFFMKPLVDAWIISARGQTIAQRLTGVQIRDGNGDKPGFWRLVLRETLGKWVSNSVFGLGFLWIAWDPQKRGWHDHIAGTYVVRIGTLKNKFGIGVAIGFGIGLYVGFFFGLPFFMIVS